MASFTEFLHHSNYWPQLLARTVNQWKSLIFSVRVFWTVLYAMLCAVKSGKRDIRSSIMSILSIVLSMVDSLMKSMAVTGSFSKR